MAHIPDGVLSVPVLACGAALALAGITIAVRRLDADQLPQAAVLGAVLFVAALVHVPVGPTSVHLLLSGLAGLILGWTAVPVLAVALTLQLVFFGFGGVTSLGVNIVDMATPALIVAATMGPLLRRSRHHFLVGALSGFLGVALTAVMVCSAIALSGSEYRPALGIVAMTYLPLALVEAVVTGAAITLLVRVKPEVLAAPVPAGG